MLKVTYARFCDACGAPGIEDAYTLTTVLRSELPAPPGPMRLFGASVSADLCDRCAGPVAEALREVFQAAVIKRRG